MNTKFNSLFDNDINSTNNDYYTIDKKDESFIINNLILDYDKQKLDAIKNLGKRNLSTDTNYNYILDGRPCDTSLCTSNKFCYSSGWPEVKEDEKNTNQKICNRLLMPNSNRLPPNIISQNIDIEARLFNMDSKRNKCDTPEYKEVVCNSDDDTCSLNCESDILDKDFLISKLLKKKQQNYKKENRKTSYLCNVKENSFKTFQPTKRRDTIKW